MDANARHESIMLVIFMAKTFYFRITAVVDPLSNEYLLLRSERKTQHHHFQDIHLRN
jgi:hypothetical protein